MSPSTFENLLHLVGPLIKKQSTVTREPISAAERLTMIIHYLAYGDSQQSISFSYRIAKSTVSSIVCETCLAIWEALCKNYLRPPENQSEWKEIATQFEDLWNFPRTVGAINGNYVAIKCPLKSGSQFFNYKGYFSIVLLATCHVDIGDHGSNNDSGVFTKSEMGKLFQTGNMNLPDPELLDNSRINLPLPYYIVGDEAFPLKTWLMRLYPGKNLPEDKLIFNYCLSRARQDIENAFGILSARWRIFHTSIPTSVETAEAIIQATICLHNYLCQTNSASYCPAGFVDSEDSSGEIKQGEWRKIIAKESDSALRPLPLVRGSRQVKSAVKFRDLKKYVNSDEGAVPWQVENVQSRGPLK